MSSKVILGVELVGGAVESACVCLRCALDFKQP